MQLARTPKILIPLLMVCVLTIGILVYTLMSRSSSPASSQVAQVPLVTPTLDPENPYHLPVDPTSGVILLPTRSAGVHSESVASMAAQLDVAPGGMTRIADPSYCDRLASVMRCYKSKSIDVDKIYSRYATEVPYPDDAPPVRDHKCGQMLAELAYSKAESFKAGCIW